MGTGIEQVYKSVGMKNYITQAFIMTILSILVHIRELPIIRRFGKKY